MKRVLITGKDSYIGDSVAQWLAKYPDRYATNAIDMRDDSWREHDFSQYDGVLHVAAIAHDRSRRATEDLYYRVNRDLATATAEKAKTEGVRQFIFMSSILVYGSRGFSQVINEDTPPNPGSVYGESKLQAEEGIRRLESDRFRVVIVRSPMVYGLGCKGNYSRLAKLARLLPVFPDFDNQRSMIHIDNLCEFIKFMIDNDESGLFFPQNREYVKTSEMVRLIAEAAGRNIRLIRAFNPVIRVLGPRVTVLGKVFGSLVYEMGMSEYIQDYRIRSLRESILRTEK
ncbi:MAG: NAD-dependent epimerase/dehydratase family protein [Bacillota bacterium]